MPEHYNAGDRMPEGGTIRIRRDALAPTTTLGLRVDDGVEKLIDTPPALHAAVSADYAARWPDLTPPTLAECHAFCAGAVITTTESN